MYYKEFARQVGYLPEIMNSISVINSKVISEQISGYASG
jgi:hypothetical protein